MSVIKVNETHVCDFCGKKQDEVIMMITSQNGIDICDECVVYAWKVLAGAITNQQTR